ncbi:disulfide bond formation protein B [Candidatus Pacearchaeota archaeon]|nr:disulfide bond formation protein B [Candidatus Pacearchaeota archaeon]
MELEILLNKTLGLGILVLHIILALALLFYVYHKITKKRLPFMFYNFKNFVFSNGLIFALIISVVATLGSLAYSEIIKLPPCDLCWYQRALLYPQVVILAVALVKKNRDIYDYVIGLNIIGIIIAGYQYIMQMINYSGPCPIGSGGANCFTKDTYFYKVHKIEKLNNTKV